MLAGNLLLGIVFILELGEAIQEGLILSRLFIGVDDVGGGDGFEDMVILLIYHIVVAVVMFQSAHQARLRADHDVVLEVVEEYIFIFVVAHNLVNLLIKRGREI